MTETLIYLALGIFAYLYVYVLAPERAQSNTDCERWQSDIASFAESCSDLDDPDRGTHCSIYDNAIRNYNTQCQ